MKSDLINLDSNQENSTKFKSYFSVRKILYRKITL